MPRLLIWWGLLALVACADTPRDLVDELQTRLFAPCCWRQTLADHESPLASELRAEISRRVRSGDSPGAIEADFVARYGERIRALGTSTDPRLLVGAITAAACAGGLALLWSVLRRSRRTGRCDALAHETTTDPRYSEQLDDELAVFPD